MKTLIIYSIVIATTIFFSSVTDSLTKTDSVKNKNPSQKSQSNDTNCIDDLIIDDTTPLKNLHQSNNSITTEGVINIQPNQKVEYRSNKITLNQGFSVEAGSDFTIGIDDCNFLFTPVDGEINFDTDPSSIVTRTQNVSFDPEQLLNEYQIQTLIFNEERTITFQEQYINQDLWKGTINGVNTNNILMVKSGNNYIGSFHVDSMFYQIRYIGNGEYQIKEIDHTKFPEGAEPDVPQTTMRDTGNSDVLCTTDTGEFIDVLVVYTTTSKNASGGESSIRAEIDLAVEETNLSYFNSSIHQRVRLVGAIETSYQSTDSSLGEALNFVRDDSFVISERNRLGADCVILIVEPGGYCGRAYVLSNPSATTFSEYAVGVVKRSCATGNYSFGHELGHIMGALHNCENTSSSNPFDYSHGYSYCGVNTKWRTVMGYSECGNRRIPYWSNPNVQYNGISMGDNSVACKSDNALTLNNTANVVANFRCSTVFPSDITTLFFSSNDNIRGWSWDGTTASYIVGTPNESTLVVRPFDGTAFGEYTELFFSSDDNIRGWSWDGTTASYIVGTPNKSTLVVRPFDGTTFGEFTEFFFSSFDIIRGWSWDGTTASYLVWKNGETLYVTRSFDGVAFGEPEISYFGSRDNLRSWSWDGTTGSYHVIKSNDETNIYIRPW